MATVTTASIIKATLPGVDAWFTEAYEEHKEQYSEIFTTRTSDKKYEQTVATSGMGIASVVAEGAGFTYDDVQQVYVNQYNHLKYVTGMKITKEAFTDNIANLEYFKPRSRELAFAMRTTKEMVAANILNNGFTAGFTMGTGSDGDPLFSASHTSGPCAADFSNLAAATDLSELALENMVTSCMDMKNPRGLRIMIMPWKLIIPTALWAEAGRILQSVQQYDSANNAVNVLRSGNWIPGGAVVNNYLTDSSAYFLLTSRTQQGMGLIHYQRWQLEFGVDNEFATGDACYKAEDRYSFGWDDPRAAIGSAGD